VVLASLLHTNLNLEANANAVKAAKRVVEMA
jgi:hypothetical protein